MPPKPGDLIEIGSAPVRLAVNARARRLSLRLAGGEVVATAPSARRLPEVIAFARSKADWIVAQIAAAPQVRPFRPGAVIPLRGQPVRLAGSGGMGAARLQGDVITSGGEGDAFARRVLNLLKREALADFTARTAVHARALRKPLPRVSLFDAQGRWGSCTPERQTIRYSWRVIAAPSWVLAYLAAHETAHLVHCDHSPRFWATVERIYGDAAPARRWLRTHGAELQALGG
jgi:predicted metal-dependent hydrolase